MCWWYRPSFSFSLDRAIGECVHILASSSHIGLLQYKIIMIILHDIMNYCVSSNSVCRYVIHFTILVE